MNYYSVFYWLTVADGVKKVFDVSSDVFTWFSVISFIVYAILIGCCITDKANGDEKSYKESLVWRKIVGRFYWTAQVLCVIMWLGYVLTPTKKDCMLIVAGGAVGNFITTDSSSKALPSDITKFLHLSLNKEIDELQQGVKTDIRKELGVPTAKDQFMEKVEKLSKEQLIELLKTDTTVLKTK